MPYLIERVNRGSWLRYELPVDRATFISLVDGDDNTPIVAATPGPSNSGGDTAAEIPKDTVAVLFPARHRRPIQWILLACSQAPYLNAESQPSGELTVLRGGDCLTWRTAAGGVRVHFDDFQPARIAPYEGHDTPCPICGSMISAGMPSAYCTTCGTAYHQSPEAACFEYSSRCAACESPTVLAGQPSWLPHGYSMQSTPYGDLGDLDEAALPSPETDRDGG